MCACLNAGTAPNAQILVESYIVARTVVAYLYWTNGNAAMAVDAFVLVHIDYSTETQTRINHYFLHKNA